MVLSEDEVHTLLNSLGVIKSHAELLMTATDQQAVEEGRRRSLDMMMTRLDEIVGFIQFKKHVPQD